MPVENMTISLTDPFTVVFTLTALGVFGFVKGKFTGVSKIKSALQTVLVGGCAAGVAYALAKLIS
jgi:VIT1/CCC1 family predicted Fe2+/Mn2+ transporter